MLGLGAGNLRGVCLGFGGLLWYWYVFVFVFVFVCRTGWYLLPTSSSCNRANPKAAERVLGLNMDLKGCLVFLHTSSLVNAPTGSSYAEGPNLVRRATRNSSQLAAGLDSINQQYQDKAFPSMWKEAICNFWSSGVWQ